ncbi:MULTISPECIES: SDR family oxidoreductase [unclassified Brachybacterium]|uniref:SDR family oxidoreductase n=1 Tax=unclassified Brachybacterium TaxID=2623841 RepID=UPI000C7FC3BC|nr:MULTISPECIES: SDR family oxidoreductase [unclassified Brachybacterium]PMC76827.1 short chain dehydrogenase [Brachybacterium sp. UMB0905]
MSITDADPVPTTRRPAVLITGASRGIGRAIADELAADHHLILGGRDADMLADLASAFPSAEPFAADLTDVDALGRAVAALELPEGLAGVVHSAGILVSGTVEDLSAGEWTRSFAVNVVAVAELTRLLLPALRQARGTVVTINSGSGFRAGSGGGAYSASKFALRAFTDALRIEEHEHGVRVSSLHPGRVATDMQRELRSFERGEYREDDYMKPATVAVTVGLALRLPPDASIDTLSVRPR